MIPVLFHIGPLTVYSYGLMMALGFLAADWVVTLECRRRSLPADYASSMIVWAAVTGIAASRLLDIFNNFSSYMADPKSMIFSGSGFVWYGGMIGGSSRFTWSRAATRSRSCRPPTWPPRRLQSDRRSAGSDA